MSDARPMSDAEVLDAYASALCPVCGGSKRPQSAFCRTDFYALTIWARNSLAFGPRDPQFCDHFRAALEHLRLNPARRRAYSGFRGGWSYRADDDLAAAGYHLLDHAFCRVPGCGERIRWFRGPDLRKIAVNLADNQPHRTTCADPDYVFPRRALKTSAVRRRRRAS